MDGPTTAPTATRAPRGAVVLIVSGAVLLAVALGAAVVGGLLLWRTLDTGVVTVEGGPGPDALGSGDVPGIIAVELAEPGRYTVWQVGRPEEKLLGPDDVTALGEVPVDVVAPVVSRHEARGDVNAYAVADLVVEKPGAYTVIVGPPAGRAADLTFLVAPGTELAGFVTGVGGAVVAVLVAVLGGLTGLGLLVGGIVWTVVARRSGPALASPA